MKVYVTGGFGLLGQSVCRLFESVGYLVARDPRKEVDLLNLGEIEEKLELYRPDILVHCAGLVGGLFDNRGRKADYLAHNLRMGLNVLEAARKAGVGRVVMAGSSCMYPDPCEKPYREFDAWEGRPYEGNLSYGIAKRVVAEAGRAYAEQYGLNVYTAVLPNLYGPGADSGRSGHMVANIARKIIAAHKAGAPKVEMVGDGQARRELIYVEDAARAMLFMATESPAYRIINFGTDREHTVFDVANTIKALVGYRGEIVWGSYSDNGQRRKIMDSSLAVSCGWSAKTDLADGLRKTIEASVERLEGGVGGDGGGQ